MRVIRYIEGCPPSLAEPVVALGNFDGVHLGHKAILERVVAEARARSGTSVVITFSPHPIEVLAPDKAPPAISSLRERLELLRDGGVDLVILRHFTRAFARLSAEEFVERYLVNGLRAKKVVIGHSVSFGSGRKGNAETLKAAGIRHGFEVEVVGPVGAADRVVSSTEVRRALVAGDIELAGRLLGRPYGIAGRVHAGDRRGRGLGFPTANLKPRVPLLIPDGVYAVRVEWNGEAIGGIANVGRNPTFGADRPRGLEAHLFDFEGDLYGEWIRVRPIERLRTEMKFPTPEALVEQIRRDVARAREVLATR